MGLKEKRKQLFHGAKTIKPPQKKRRLNSVSDHTTSSSSSSSQGHAQTTAPAPAMSPEEQHEEALIDALLKAKTKLTKIPPGTSPGPGLSSNQLLNNAPNDATHAAAKLHFIKSHGEPIKSLSLGHSKNTGKVDKLRTALASLLDGHVADHKGEHAEDWLCAKVIVAMNKLRAKAPGAVALLSVVMNRFPCGRCARNLINLATSLNIKLRLKATFITQPDGIVELARHGIPLRLWTAAARDQKRLARKLKGPATSTLLQQLGKVVSTGKTQKGEKASERTLKQYAQTFFGASLRELNDQNLIKVFYAASQLLWRDQQASKKEILANPPPDPLDVSREKELLKVWKDELQRINKEITKKLAPVNDGDGEDEDEDPFHENSAEELSDDD